MKRHLPRVLSSFRSSKRRTQQQQQKSQITVLEKNDDDADCIEMARSIRDVDSLSPNLISFCPSYQFNDNTSANRIIQMTGSNDNYMAPSSAAASCKNVACQILPTSKDSIVELPSSLPLIDDVMQCYENVIANNSNELSLEFTKIGKNEDVDSEMVIKRLVNDGFENSSLFSLNLNDNENCDASNKRIVEAKMSTFARLNSTRQGQNSSSKEKNMTCSTHPNVSITNSITSTISSSTSLYDAENAVITEANAVENTDNFKESNESMTIISTTHVLPSTSTGNANETKVNYILKELLNTEQSYVKELESLIEYYVKPFETVENTNLIPANLRGQSNVIFGNLKELADFHRRFVLTEFQRNSDSVSHICQVLIAQRNNFLGLYRLYCQNKPQSESLRGSIEHPNNFTTAFGEQCKFFLECQQRAGHLLPLGAYLLKPIQRITKYQLLLKELLRYCTDTNRNDAQTALAAMLDLLAQLNADMQQLHILGFAGDLRLFGPLRLQTECEVYVFKRKSHRLANKPQKRHLFLFDGGVLFCKKRIQPLQYTSEYYEHKLCIPMNNLGFAECSKWSPERFEIWDESRSDGYAVKVSDEDEKVRAKWITRLARLTTLYVQQQRQQRVYDSTITNLQERRHSSYFSSNTLSNTAQQQWLYQQQQQQQQQQHQKQQQQQLLNSRPQSWTSDGSCSVSSRSSISALEDGQTITNDFVVPDTNGNLSPTELSIPVSASAFFNRCRLSSLVNTKTFTGGLANSITKSAISGIDNNVTLTNTNITSNFCDPRTSNVLSENSVGLAVSLAKAQMSII